MPIADKLLPYLVWPIIWPYHGAVLFWGAEAKSKSGMIPSLYGTTSATQVGK